jgi:hypothetical protein
MGGWRFLICLGVVAVFQVSVVWLEWKHLSTFNKVRLGLFTGTICPCSV